MNATLFTPFRFMCAISASAMMLSFCVVLNTQRLRASIGSTTAVVPTGASIGVLASAINSTTPIAFGEPDGPISASIFCSASSFLTLFTLCVGSLASSSAKYSIVVSPTFFGSSATEFFWATPTKAVGPVAELTTPIRTCAYAAEPIIAAIAATTKCSFMPLNASMSFPPLELFKLHDEPAACEHHLPADVIGFRDAEQVHGPRGFFRRAPSAEGDHPFHEGEHFRLHAHLHFPLADMRDRRLGTDRLGHSRADVTERDRVDVDVVPAPLLRQRLRETDDRSLARRVRDLAGVAVQTGDRRHVHDLSLHDAPFVLFLLRELAQRFRRRAEDPERRARVHVEHGVPLVVGHLLDHAVPRVAGVVHDDVEPAEALDRRANEACRKIGLRHVTRARRRLAALPFDGARRRIGHGLVDVVQHDACALGGELGGDGGADAT